MMPQLREHIKRAVEAQSLTLLGIAQPVIPQAEKDHYTAWLAQGKHADMGYMQRNQEASLDPQRILAGVKAVIVMGLNYGQNERWQDVKASGVPTIAQYARLKDYHKTFAHRSVSIIEELKKTAPLDAQFRAISDSVPMLERHMAQKTLEGFIGKNTMYIHPHKGSLMLLGEILTTWELPFDHKEDVEPTKRSKQGGCGTCQRCQVYCPTGALDNAYQVDATKCLSYWTIENRGPIPTEYWPWLRYYYYGCDICQLVCPYNRGATPTKETPTSLPNLFEVATMDQTQYEKLFGGTPLTRAKIHGLRRNALIAMTVTNHPRLQEALDHVNAKDHPVIVHTAEAARTWLNNAKRRPS
jgi:epoxyqueuosine reductase